MSTLFANKAIDSIIKLGERGIMCQLDIEKGNDYSNWNFLGFILRIMGFVEKWRKWFG